MKWNYLNNLQDLANAIELSQRQKVLFFKHSTRCPISAAALDRIERNWKDTDSQIVAPFFLDLIAHREVSNEIARLLGVEHQSPQALILHKGKCVYHASHQAINYCDIIKS